MNGGRRYLTGEGDLEKGKGDLEKGKEFWNRGRSSGIWTNTNIIKRNCHEETLDIDDKYKLGRHPIGLAPSPVLCMEQDP